MSRYLFMGGLPALGALLAVALPAAPLRAEMVLSQVIVDFHADKPAREDIEVFNSGSERLYVAAEPAEILEPGTSAQQRVKIADPRVAGLLVSPQRMVLEPGQRRLVRIAAVAPRSARDRVFRVTIKPVAGPLTADASAVKVFVGYDVLVIQRPGRLAGAVAGERIGPILRIRNIGNTAVELFDGQQCDTAEKACAPLPATRLYAGAAFDVSARPEASVRYQLRDGQATRAIRF